MFKLIIIALIVGYLMRGFFRLMYPQAPKSPTVSLELKPCEYCAILTREDRGVLKQGRFFCTREHAERYFR